MPQPRRMRDASGLGSRLAGDLEPGLFDLLQEIAGEAGLDAQGALDPLPGLRHHILRSHWRAASFSGPTQMIVPRSAI